MLAKSDVSEMIHLLGLLEETQNRKDFFDVLCHGFENLLNIALGAFIPYDRAKESFCIEGHLLHNIFSAHFMNYVTHYSTLDFVNTSGWTMKGPSLVAVAHDFPEAYQESEMMVDFVRGQLGTAYAIAIRIVTQGDLMGFMTFHRTKERNNFENRERTIVETLAESIATMFHHREFFEGSDPLSDPDTGFLVVGANGEILCSNPMGQQAIQEIPPYRLRTLGVRQGPTFVRSRGMAFRVRNFPMRSESSTSLEVKIKGQSRQEARILLFEPLFKKDTNLAGLDVSDLTPKQREVTLRVLRGLTNREIAEEFGIAEQTVKVHLNGIFDRLGFRNRSDLTAHFTKPAPPVSNS